MPENPPKTPQVHSSEFDRLAAAKSPSIISEFIDFLRHNKKWWLIPLVLILLGVGVLLFAGGGAAAPFIYTLF